jgi:hypothetical protein
MALSARIRSFWHNLRHRSEMERNMSDELQFHLACRAEDIRRLSCSTTAEPKAGRKRHPAPAGGSLTRTRPRTLTSPTTPTSHGWPRQSPQRYLSQSSAWYPTVR